MARHTFRLVEYEDGWHVYVRCLESRERPPVETLLAVGGPDFRAPADDALDPLPEDGGPIGAVPSGVRAHTVRERCPGCGAPLSLTVTLEVRDDA